MRCELAGLEWRGYLGGLVYGLLDAIDPDMHDF